MMRFCRRLPVQASPAAVSEYFHHLFPKNNIDIQTMADLVPNDIDGVDEAYKFQRYIRDKFQREGNRVVGYKFLLPADTMLKNLRSITPHVAPLFDTFCYESGATLEMKAKRVQQVELTLLVELSSDPMSTVAESADVTSASQGASNTSSASPSRKMKHPLPPWVAAVRPCIELTGSRFPFFAPHLPGYIADLASHVALVRGPRVSREQLELIDPDLFDLNENGAVLLCGAEPVQVGYPRQAFGGVEHAVPNAFKLSRDNCGGDMDVACGMEYTIGSLGRTQAKLGGFKGLFGPLGSVEVTLE